ncbi:MAG: hypothetical protein KatS3mg087_0327 [Patescibacteria group bacterium]|nr:MAG: hypothetical protein KatS3mg087_0327 [Patescibacteria group bacterium]
MRIFWKLSFIGFITFGIVLLFNKLGDGRVQNTGAPPYAEPQEAAPEKVLLPLPWVRPDGPPKVGLQVGHWKNNELPAELSKLIGNTGASGGGKWEWEVNLKIAEQTKMELEELGVVVELIPATVPPKYWADVFIAIHADGSENKSKSGYKFAAPWRDFTGKAEKLVQNLESEYEKATGLTKDPNVTRNMRGYYAFAWWRYEHAIHPMTTATIAETGFLTNISDQDLLIKRSEVSVAGLANGIEKFLRETELLK